MKKKKLNFSWEKIFMIADQMMVSGSNFLLGILLVRCLGLETYGVFALLWLAVLFGLSINHALITKPILSIVPKMKDQMAQEYLQNVQCLQGMLSLLLFSLGLGFWLISNIFTIEENIIQFTPIVAGILFFQMYHDFFRKKYFIENRVLLVLSIDLVLYIGPLISILIVFLQGTLTLSTVLYIILVANIFSVGIAWFQSRSKPSTRSALQDTFYKQFQYAKWLLGTALLQWFSGNFFIIIGASVLGPIAVGALRMVQNLMGFCHIIFLTMENIIPIEAAQQLQQKGWSAMSKYLIKTTLQIGMIFLVLLMIIAGMAPWLITNLYGSEYLEYSYLIIAYCLLYVLVFLGHPFQFALRTIEQTYPLFIAYVCSTIFSLLTAHLFITQWGMTGLIAGLLSTQLITLSIYSFYFFKIQKHANHTFSTR